MTWGKRREEKKARRALSITLATLLAVALSPALPSLPASAPTTIAKAEERAADTGFAGTTDYSVLFKPENITGEPALLSGSTLRVGSTLDPSHYDFQMKTGSYPYEITSDAQFISREPISLAKSWIIHAKAMASPIVDAEMEKYFFFTYFGIYFMDGPSHPSSGLSLCTYGQEWNYSWTAPQATTYANRSVNGANQTRFNEKKLPDYDEPSLEYSYDAPTDTITVHLDGEQTLQVANVRKDYFGGASECWLALAGGIGWDNRFVTSLDPDNPLKYPATQTRTVGLTFESISLPNLDPEIDDIALFRYNEATGTYDIPVGKYDALAANEVVQVRCAVSNRAPGATRNGYDERFSMHLKLANTAVNPTQGINPFADATHPLQVDGTTVATASGPDTLTGKNGVPITLAGYNKPVTVTYFARVNQISGQPVKVSHELLEDTFHGSRLKTRDLIGEQPLKPADGNDSTLVPGRDYHYTRLPAANENGWNGIATSPVDVTFFGGEGCDFDQFTVSGPDGSSIATLTPEANVWTQRADVDALPVEFKATGSATDSVSTKGSDVIRIDTEAPKLTYDAATGALMADDTAPASSGKATSGIWSIRQVKSDGRPLATENVTPDSVGAAAFSTEADRTTAASAPSRATGQTEWKFTLAEGKGSPAETISNVPAGFYVAEDAAGNASPVVEVAKPENPNPGPDDPTPIAPTYPTITPKPDGTGGTAPEPLRPTEVTTDPDTSLSHALVEDTLALPTSSKSVTAAMMAQLIDERYVVGTSLADGNVTAGPVRLFDAAGNPVDVIDRARPGTWVAEQTFTDAAGNTTTLRLTITVRDDSATGSLGNGGGSQSGTGGDNIANGHRTALANRVAQLPQTGGIFGSCPLHILFILMMLMASAYSLMRLRRRMSAASIDDTDTGQRDQQEAIPCEAAIPPRYRKDDAAPFRYTAFDGIVHGAIAVGAIALGCLAFCPWDIPLAVATVLVVAFWIALMLGRGRHAQASAKQPSAQP